MSDRAYRDDPRFRAWAAAAGDRTPTDADWTPTDADWMETCCDLAQEVGAAHREAAETHARLRDAVAREVRHLALLRRHEAEIDRLRGRPIRWWQVWAASLLTLRDSLIAPDRSKVHARWTLPLACALCIAAALAAIWLGPGGRP